MLDICLLGTPRVFLNEEQVTIQRKATRSLFFYLAMHPHGVDRGALAELFGGDGDDESKKRTNLRRNLNHVRNIQKDVELVLSYHGSICFNPDFVRVDALRLLENAEEIQKSKGAYRSDGRTIPYGLYQKVQGIVASLDGETFCDSTDFDWNIALGHWRTEEDRRLKNAQGILYTFLAEMATHFNDPKAACFWAERALKIDASEEAYYFQLKSLRDMGNFGKARTCYLEVRELFGDDVSQRLHTLGENILTMKEANSMYVRPVWAVRPTVPAPFAGQSEVLQRMKMNYQRGIGTLLTGEAGAGKTRLVQEFYESLPLPPNLILVPCYRDSENLPYQPWTDMLRHSFDKDFWQTTPAWWTKPLTMLLPELHTYRDDLDSEPGDVFANALVFEAVKNLLIFANQQRSALLFVEDAQWMNSISFALLKYLILQSTFKQWNIGLVVTSRLGIHSGVDRFEFGAMQGKLDEIEIPYLGNEEIKYLAFYLLNKELTEEKIEYLQKLTGGNPFFLLELLNFHAIHEDVDIFENASPSPPSIQKLINTRLNTLAQRTRNVLNYAAIQGSQFSLSVLEEVLGLPMTEMTDVVTELEDARLVQFMRKDGDLFYIFRQDKIREEIIKSFSEADLRLMHADIANILAQKRVYQHENAAVLAEHYEGAGELQKAFWSWHEAANHAYRLFSQRDSYVAFRRAEKLLPRIDLSNEEIYRFYLSWDLVLFNSDEPDKLEEVMERLLVLGEERSSQLLIGAALDWMSDVCMARNQFEKGLAYVEEALPYLIMAAHIPAQLNAFIHQGVFSYMLNNFPDALDSFRTVISLGEGYDDPQSIFAIGHAHYQIAVSMTGMGYPSKALEHAKKSLHYMRLSSVPHSSILPHSIMGLANYYLGEYLEGRRHALRSFELSKQSDSWRMLGYSAAYAGMNETELPELELAWQHAQDAITHGEKHGHTEIVAMGYKIMGDIYTRLDAPTKAVKSYQRGLAVDKASFVTVENATRLGVTLGLLGDPRGDASLEEALAHAKAAGLETIEFNARALQLSLFVTREDDDAFNANYELICAVLTERSHPKSFVWINYLQALRLFRQGKLEESLALLEETLPILDKTLFFWIHLRAEQLHLDVLKALGRDPSQPRAKLAEMLAKIEAGLGDAPLRDEWLIFSERIKEM